MFSKTTFFKFPCLLVTVFLCLLLNVSVNAQCNIEVSYIEVDNGSQSNSETPHAYCFNDVIQIPVVSYSGVDVDYVLTTSIGFTSKLRSEEIQNTIADGFAIAINITQADFITANGVQIIFEGLNDGTCVGGTFITWEELGLTSVSEFCCPLPTWIDDNVASSEPAPFCYQGSVVIPFAIGGEREADYLVTASHGRYSSSTNPIIVYYYDGVTPRVDSLILSPDDIADIAGGNATLTIKSNVISSCEVELSFSLDGEITYNDYCESINSLVNDLCNDAVALSNGASGPYSNENASYDINLEPISPNNGCFNADDNYSSTIWFEFYGSGQNITISSNNNCTTSDDEDLTDTQFGIYTSCNGNFVTCNDDIDAATNNTFSSVTFLSENGKLYYLIVDGFEAQQGEFCLEASGIGPPCNLEKPTLNLTNTNFCEADASVIISPATGNNLFDIYYLITDISGNIVGEPQLSNSFNPSNLPTGKLYVWAANSIGSIISLNGKLNGLEGCFTISTSADFFIEEASNWYADNDNDGLGDAAIFIQSCTMPNGNYVLNDNDPNDNCNGNVDECGVCNGNGGAIWYQDFDNDGLGNPTVFIQSCEQPDGYVANNLDDSDAAPCSIPPAITYTYNDCGINVFINNNNIEATIPGIGTFTNQFSFVPTEIGELNMTLTDQVEGCVFNEVVSVIYASPTVDIICNEINGSIIATAFANGGSGNFTFTWQNGSTNQILTVTENMTVLSVVVNDLTIDCTAVASGVDCLNPTSSNNIINDKAISIYPNPASNYLFIEAANLLTKVEIFDLSGKLVLAQNQQLNKIDVSQLNTGIYLVKAFDKQLNFTSNKLLVE